MDSRFKKVNLLDLAEVENEIDTLISIVGDKIVDQDTYEYVVGLIAAAKALGTKRAW